jgi:uncharacterized lipoprotein YmbA
MTRRLAADRVVAALTALAAGAVGACSVLPQPRAAAQVFDLGPPARVVVPAAAARLEVGAVTAPEWLGGNEIRYRLAFDEPQQLRSYARHRLVAPPAELFGERLRQILARARADHPSAASPPPVRLEVVLETFEQRFASRHSAAVVIGLRAQLARPGGPPFATRVFSWRRPSGPDAPGAATALAGLTDAALGELVAWAAGRAVSRPGSGAPAPSPGSPSPR